MINRTSNTTQVPGSDCTLSPKQASILSVAAALFALAPSLSMTATTATNAVAWLICLAFGALVLITSRKFVNIFILTLVLSFFASSTGSAASVALIVGTISACGIYSALSATLRGGQIAFLALIPVVACTGTHALTQSVGLVLATLAIFPPSLCMGISLRRGGSRTDAIAGFAALAAIELCGIVLLHIYMAHGQISMDTVSGAASYFRHATEELFTVAIEAGGMAITEDVALIITDMAVVMTNLLVGLACASIITIGFFAQKVQHSVFERLELERLQNESGAPLKASVAAGIVYVAAYICSFTTGSSGSISFVSVAAGNISLILLPLLVYVGFSCLTRLPKKIGFLSLLAWLGVAVASYMLASSIIEIIALVGAFHTLLLNIDSWAEEHYSKGGEQ